MKEALDTYCGHEIGVHLIGCVPGYIDRDVRALAPASVNTRRQVQNDPRCACADIASAGSAMHLP